MNEVDVLMVNKVDRLISSYILMLNVCGVILIYDFVGPPDS